MRALALISLGILLGGCNDSGGADAGVPPADAGKHDAGPVDSGRPDAGLDAGHDAGTDAGPECSSVAPCDGGTCCQGSCVDLTHDIANCGACGNACAADQFCTGVACLAVQFRHVCANPLARVLLDGHTSDDDAGRKLGASIETLCVPPPSVRYLPQEDAGLDPASGKPLVGGSELLVAVGGNFVHNLVDYLDQSGLSPVFDSSEGTNLSLSTRDAGVLVSVDRALVNAGHDYLVVELVRQPDNGSLALAAYGFFEQGTAAASWYLGHQILPAPGALANRWFVVEWTDQNQNSEPDSADLFTVKATGN